MTAATLTDHTVGGELLRKAVISRATGDLSVRLTREELELYSPKISELDLHVIDQITRGATDPASNKLNAIAIRTYGDLARDVVLAKRADRRVSETVKQRKVQAGTSRRAQRGNHHDSWCYRESIVRGGVSSGTATSSNQGSLGSTPKSYFAIGHDMIADAIEAGATHFGMHVLTYVRRNPEQFGYPHYIPVQ